MYKTLFLLLILFVCSSGFSIAIAGSLHSCMDLYKTNFQLVQGKDFRSYIVPDKPIKNVEIIDDSLTTCRVRVTDFKNEPPKGFARNDYSRRQPFNSNEKYLLTYAKDGYWHLYETEGNKYFKKLNLGGGSVEPHWHPKNPGILFTLPNNGGLKMFAYDIYRDKHDVIADFTNIKSINGYPGSYSIQDIWPTAARVWTKSEGSPSRDARYWAFQVETSKFKPLGLITYDLKQNKIIGVFDFLLDGDGIGRPDHISMSPSGKYVVPSWHVPNDCQPKHHLGDTDNPCGLMVYTADFKEGYGITSRGPHSDIALDLDGNDVLVISNYITGYVEMYNLTTHKKTNLFSLYLDGSATAMHFSGKAYNKPGWILVSTYATKKASKWWSDKIFAVELTDDPKIYIISNTYNKMSGYWTEPHAVVNSDFTKVIFNSNWLTANEDIDVYMIHLPNDSIR